MKKVTELTQIVVGEITEARRNIRRLNSKWILSGLPGHGELTRDDWRDYYGARKTLFMYALQYSRQVSNRKEQDWLERNLNDAWRMYNWLKGPEEAEAPAQ